MSRTAIVVGQTTFRDVVMDYNPIFRVVEKKPGGLYRCVSEDEYDGGYGGVERFFSADQISQKVSWENTLNGLHQLAEDFWASVKVGQVLHYHNGFGEFVRGVVIEEGGKKKLKPTALVGNWPQRELPSRRPNGEIYYPYHAKKVLFGGEDAAWQPNDGCVYESLTYSRRNETADPATMDPIDLSVPEPTAEEALEQAKVRKLSAIGSVVSERYQTKATPDEALEEIRRLLERPVAEF